MYRLCYLINGEIRESYFFPSRQLAYWKMNQFKKAGTHNYGTFKIIFEK